jgi:hypothetical protein
VVQQLLHAPKIPPCTGKGRRRKLQFTLQVTEAGSGNAVPVGQVLQRGQSSVAQVAVVKPGGKYWLAARLSCNVSGLRGLCVMCVYVCVAAAVAPRLNNNTVERSCSESCCACCIGCSFGLLDHIANIVHLARICGSTHR